MLRPAADALPRPCRSTCGRPTTPVPPPPRRPSPLPSRCRPSGRLAAGPARPATLVRSSRARRRHRRRRRLPLPVDWRHSAGWHGRGAAQLPPARAASARCWHAASPPPRLPARAGSSPKPGCRWATRPDRPRWQTSAPRVSSCGGARQLGGPASLDEQPRGTDRLY